MQNKKKIAVIYTHFPHYRAAVFKALSRNDCGYEFDFYFDFDGIDSTIKNGDSSFSAFNAKTLRLGRFLWQGQALKVAMFGGYSSIILLGNPYILSNWFLIVVCKIRRISVFLWTHGWIADRKSIIECVRMIFYKLSDGLFLYGNRAKLIGASKGYSPSRMWVIGNSLDYNFQSKVRERLTAKKSELFLAAYGLESGGFLFCCSRAVPEAQLDLAIRAVSNLRSDFKLVIVGDGPSLPYLKSLARENRNIVFLGSIYDESVLAILFSHCKAVISPAKVGLLAMHALVYNAYIITHGDLDYQMPEVEALVDGVTASFFKHSDINSLMETVARVVDRRFTLDELVLRRKISTQCLESLFIPEAQVKLICDALNKNAL